MYFLTPHHQHRTRVECPAFYSGPHPRYCEVTRSPACSVILHSSLLFSVILQAGATLTPRPGRPNIAISSPSQILQFSAIVDLGEIILDCPPFFLLPSSASSVYRDILPAPRQTPRPGRWPGRAVAGGAGEETVMRRPGVCLNK